jgi:hypothetical protein
LLEGHAGVVVFLVVDVFDAGFDGGFADGEGGVAILPLEGGEFRGEGFDPAGGVSFDGLEEIGEGHGFGEKGEEVEVVGHAGDADEFGAGVFDDAGDVAVEAGFDGGGDEGETVFGGEDDVGVEFDEGLGHGPVLRGRKEDDKAGDGEGANLGRCAALDQTRTNGWG